MISSTLKTISVYSLIFFTLMLTSCSTSLTGDSSEMIGSLNNIIPKPVEVNETGNVFNFEFGADIYVEPYNSETAYIAQYLADKIKPPTGYNIFVMPAKEKVESGNIYLKLEADESLGDEGYEIIVSEELITLKANKPEGLFRGVQTLRQIFNPAIDSKEIKYGVWQIPTGAIKDYPRFEWRGVMLDVARHFFSVEDVKSYIDMAAYYKINRFHLHIADDQGWRILINSWPNLTSYGGTTQVGGGKGGYYTQSEYSEIVKYAQQRYITIVPEIDMPGHTNAALASYPELNKDGIAPDLYTGIKVGFSALDVNKEITYKFIDDVVRELAAITPGPYIHVGGDEAPRVDSSDYVIFMNKVEKIIHSYGKKMIGWDDISVADLSQTSVVQHWAHKEVLLAVDKGNKIIMSPSSKMYMDMQYDSTTRIGLHWAAYIEVKDGYDWDPSTFMNGISEKDILGVEAPLWTETILNLDDIEYMVFPRLPGYAEIGWTPKDQRNWEEYKERLADHGLRWIKMDINYYRSPQIQWR